MTKVPLTNDRGEIMGIVGVNRDITLRKQFEAGLLESKEAAEAANRAKSEFLANMSHEIRTPMNGIIGMTDLVLETPLTQEQSEMLGIVKNSADSLLRSAKRYSGLFQDRGGKTGVRNHRLFPARHAR